jgi:hypothetical protein
MGKTLIFLKFLKQIICQYIINIVLIDKAINRARRWTCIREVLRILAKTPSFLTQALPTFPQSFH